MPFDIWCSMGGNFASGAMHTHVSRVGQDHTYTVYTVRHGSTAHPEIENIEWSKCATAPHKNKYFTVLHCNLPPLAGTSRQVQRVQAGLGLGVQRQAKLGFGGQGVLGR